MSGIFQRERSMVTYDQKFRDIMRLYNVSRDQLEYLLSGKLTVEKLLDTNENYIQADNEFAKIRLESEIAELRKINKNKI